ncbi:MAG: hypothetical protein ACYC65_11755 [Candidatus Limnocylindrales bacterium]
MRKRTATLGALALVALLVAACGTAASGSPLPVAAECSGILPLRDAYADASGAATAIREGRPADAAPLGVSAKSKAAAVVAGLPPTSNEATTPFRAAIEQAATSLGTFGDLIASGVRVPVTGEEATAYFSAVGQSVRTVETIATAGWNGAPAACPGIEPLTAALPMLVPLPAGTVEMQQLAVLAELHLAPAGGVRFDPGERIQWIPGFVVLGNVTLDNATGGPITIPMELTVFGWDGTAWRRQPCQFADANEPASGLCGVTNTNAQVIAPGTRTSETDNELFFTLGAVEPGTYALVLPVRRGSDEYPEGAPTEAAVAIVTITTNP